MPVRCLRPRRVERVWGRTDIGWPFEANDDARIGEIWFDDGDDAALLVKYLYTSERLSIQVHPDDQAARARGHSRGKDEAWLVLAAAPDAVIGIGLTEPVSRSELRAAATDGRLEALVDWRPVRAGDIYYSPGGTIHAIGAGIALIEIQQNIDLTYRLFDYGRARELHLDDGVAVAQPAAAVARSEPRLREPGREILAAGPAFTLERLRAPCRGMLKSSAGRPVSMVLLRGHGEIDGQRLEAGSVWVADDDAPLELADGGELLIAYPGPEIAGALLA